MSGRSKGSDYELHIFTEEGRVEVVAANDMNDQPNINSSRVQRTGTTETETDVEHNGWQIQATFDRESFALDDAIDAQENSYYDGEPIGKMEIVMVKAVPALDGATRAYRYPDAVITSYQDGVQGQNESAEISVTFETGRRIKAGG